MDFTETILAGAIAMIFGTYVNAVIHKDTEKQRNFLEFISRVIDLATPVILTILILEVLSAIF